MKYYYIGDRVYFEVYTYGEVLFQGFGTVVSFYDYEGDPQCYLKQVQFSYTNACYELSRTSKEGYLPMRMKYIK